MEFETYYQAQMPDASISPNAQAMDMRSMAGALPDLSSRNYPQHSFQQMAIPSGHHQAAMYQHYAQGPQFAGQAGGAFNLHSAQQYQPQYSQSQHQRHGNFSGFVGGPNQPPSFLSPGLPISQGMAQNVQGHHHMQQFLHPQSSPQYGTGYNTRAYQQPLRVASSLPAGSGMYQNTSPNSLLPPSLIRPLLTVTAVTRTSSNSSMHAASSSVLRGPPRKPKQSGHALWVGNLPPGTHILDLKDHFSRDATKDIESVFLISKSNCAFVNYKTEESCQAAMSRFHDSRFQNVRLVCRLRRGSSSSAPPTPQTSMPPESSSSEFATSEQETTVESTTSGAYSSEQPQEKVKEKYFVVKSLTIEDLERSVHSGVWATQAHNEVALTKAYETAENVYLIFSANKSGEYFGYARMESVIGDEEAAAKTEIPPPSANPQPIDSSLVDVPVNIPTPATATAPSGRIIDDSSRGTIFWEADSIEEDVARTDGEEHSGNVSSGEAGYESAVSGAPSASPGSATPQSFGKPFKITWVSTDKLPFYRTRGLRNPWNANREVKIARDGTEIEPSVGRRLVGLFGQPFQAPMPQQGAGRAMPPPPHMGPGMGGGFMGQAHGGIMPPGYGRGY
ncbi:uncharacterized protein HMPREF1541_06820 [Cyphellophora europaea CBS 101466]|uniref:YTH domain-containing protein n=1 Tax=Cyphellophora europaea (strain CBS 101466) TaxID=1220924 RepID=W2RQP3_CYPE1|nr:uncharacterized protein HMPREF1541_06820 [Cyphellophora europaea CBS 101466]ETN38782.1 hypothetical protein HMPREF1541_06820 [Cyphellophora europaea CBS 101466]